MVVCLSVCLSDIILLHGNNTAVRHSVTRLSHGCLIPRQRFVLCRCHKHAAWISHFTLVGLRLCPFTGLLSVCLSVSNCACLSLFHLYIPCKNYEIVSFDRVRKAFDELHLFCRVLRFHYCHLLWNDMQCKSYVWGRQVNTPALSIHSLLVYYLSSDCVSVYYT
jgi:hypothetical protein